MKKLQSIADTYGFRYQKEEDGKGRKSEFLLARNDEYRWVPWIRSDSNGNLVIYGTTGDINLWFYDTRPDLTPEAIVQFVRDLSEMVGKTLPVSLFIDPEDWQEIADVNNAGMDPRYTGEIRSIARG